MGKYKYLVDSSALIEDFKRTYHIPQGVNLKYCPPEGLLLDRAEGQVIIPMIAFLKGGMTIPMGPVTQN